MPCGLNCQHIALRNFGFNQPKSEEVFQFGTCSCSCKHPEVRLRWTHRLRMGAEPWPCGAGLVVSLQKMARKTSNSGLIWAPQSSTIDPPLIHRSTIFSRKLGPWGPFPQMVAGIWMRPISTSSHLQGSQSWKPRDGDCEDT